MTVRMLDTPPLAGASLRTLALARLARLAPDAGENAAPELAWLRAHAREAGPPAAWPRQLQQTLRAARERSDPLILLADALELEPAEMMTIALAAAIDDDALAGRVVARLQAPLGGSRPTVAMLVAAFDDTEADGTPLRDILTAGAAVRTGVLLVHGDGSPFPERTVSVPLHLGQALRNRDALPPGATLLTDSESACPLPASLSEQVVAHARALGGDDPRALLIRTGSQAEGRAVAQAIATQLVRRAVVLDAERLASVGPWLLLRELLPVFAFELGPGERRTLPHLPGYRGPVLALAGPDGSVDSVSGAALSWRLVVPPAAERAVLWYHALGDDETALTLAYEHRHGAGRIAYLGRLTRHVAALDGSRAPTVSDVAEAAWSAEGGGLDSLAEPIRDRVDDAALVLQGSVYDELHSLLHRCQLRDELVNGLGASATARYRPGVRALFTGPSGTGKTLAAAWLATALNLPLYRVDLASVTSKYIGETEKNLAQLLARAEQAEVVLLFDEADAMFGKRTDVKDANDRFANAQTNYLLQRIESFDGIVVLTSNSRGRFDAAFSRRLDLIIEFPLPGPEERRGLWYSHLGDGHEVTPQQLNQIAARAEFAGGHIRNAVFAAAAQARTAGEPIRYADLLVGIAGEYRKLGRQLPAELKQVP